MELLSFHNILQFVSQKPYHFLEVFYSVRVWIKEIIQEYWM